MERDDGNSSRHGAETQEEREFRESLADRQKSRGFFRDLMKAVDERKVDEDR